MGLGFGFLESVVVVVDWKLGECFLGCSQPNLVSECAHSGVAEGMFAV